MSRRGLFGGCLVIVCLATLWGVWGQRSQLAGLRAEQQQLLAARADGPGRAEAAAAGPGTSAPLLVVTPELLRLRSEVTRLTERRRELEGAQAENEHLHAQLASRSSNGPQGVQLPPPGYIRRSEARMVGYGTPEATVQSLLWAIQNHDLTNVLQAFAPDRAEALRAQAGASPQSIEDFWNETAGLVGIRIVSREPDAGDGTIAVEAEVIPGEAGPRITFRQNNGQWKISGPF